MSKQKGFTLTELLIALVLLGVIASFAIPKVLKATADQRKGAILREAVAMLEDAYYGNRVEGDAFGATDSLYNYIIGDVNYIQAGESTAAGTLNAAFAAQNTACDNNIGWILLPNGAIIAGLEVDANTDYHQICIDVDGVGGLNAYGTDQFVGNFIHQNTGKSFFWSYGTCAGGAADCTAGDLGDHDAGTVAAGPANGDLGTELINASTS
jgi:prepilin-type N-terminal cleavage/methylation domain-containing protein